MHPVEGLVGITIPRLDLPEYIQVANLNETLWRTASVEDHSYSQWGLHQYGKFLLSGRSGSKGLTSFLLCPVHILLLQVKLAWCTSCSVALGCPSWHLERPSSCISCPVGSVLDTHLHPSPTVGGLQSVELLFPIHFQTFNLLMLAEIQAVGKAICIKERGSLFKPVIFIHRSKIMILLSHCFMESICLFTTLAAIGT